MFRAGCSVDRIASIINNLSGGMIIATTFKQGWLPYFQGTLTDL
jgi:hypothetical protein